MIRTEHTQTVSDFRSNYAEVLERLNDTGDAEILTQNGEARAVMLSPRAYDELAEAADLARTMAAIERSRQEIAEGKGRTADEVLADGRSKLLAKLKQTG